jgi:hypothetical protein
MLAKLPTSGGRICYASRREREMRERLPYGILACDDGREVLFNRWYQPIWERRPGEPAVEADADERIPFAQQRWFFTDTNPPWGRRDPKAARATRARCQAILVAWGVAA